MSIEIVPTGAALGAEIRGVNLAEPKDSGSCRNGLQADRIAAALDHGSAFATSGGSVTGRIWAAIEMPVIAIGSEIS